MSKFVVPSFLCVYLAILASTNFWGFIPYQKTSLPKSFSALVIVFLLVTFLLNVRKKRKGFFSKEIMMLIIVPFISAFSCYIYRGQDIVTSVVATRKVLFLVVYFVLLKTAFDGGALERIIVKFAIVATLIYIVQQIFYPSLYYFDGILDGKTQSRNGLMRFRLFCNNPYIYYAFFLFASFFFKTRKLRDLAGSMFFFIGIYLTLTRQIWFCCLLPVFAVPLFSDTLGAKKKMLFAVASCLCIVLLSFNLDRFVDADFANQTSAQLQNEDDIRMRSLYFYGFEYWVDGWNVLFGNGKPSFGHSSYGNYIQTVENNLRMFRSDIGIVGVLSEYGAIYIIALLAYYKKILKYISLFSDKLKMLFVASIINLPLASWDMFPVFLGMITYMAECELRNRSKTHV